MTTDPGTRRPQRSLALAAVLVAGEGLVLLGVALLVVASSGGSRWMLDVTTSAFFLAYAGGLMACSRGLWRHRTWARGPVVFAQLIQLGVAWSFNSGSTLPVAAALLVAAVTVLGLVLAPPSTAALRRD